MKRNLFIGLLSFSLIGLGACGGEDDPFEPAGSEAKADRTGDEDSGALEGEECSEHSDCVSPLSCLFTDSENPGVCKPGCWDMGTIDTLYPIGAPLNGRVCTVDSVWVDQELVCYDNDLPYGPDNVIWNDPPEICHEGEWKLLATFSNRP